MNEELLASLARDVGYCKANTDDILTHMKSVVDRVNAHETYISQSKSRWAWLSGVAAVLSLASGLVTSYVQSFWSSHVR